MKAKINAILVKQLEPKERAYDVRDSDLKGFLIRVNKSGKLVYMCEYGRAKRIMIGIVGMISMSNARHQAKMILADAIRGIDPKQKIESRHRNASKEKSVMTLERFIDEIYSPWFKIAHPRTWPSTIKDIKRNFLPDFGQTPLKAIARPMIEHWRVKRADMERVRIKDGETVKEKVKPLTINRNIATLSALFNKAVAFGHLDNNPLEGMKKLKTPSAERIRFLSKEEYQRLMIVLDTREEELRDARDRYNRWRTDRHLDCYPNLRELTFADHIKPMALLALGSGIRQGAMMRLQWKRHIDLSAEQVVIKLTADIVKTEQERRIPLDRETSTMLKQWYEQCNPIEQKQVWVFPGEKPNSHITSVKKSWKALLKKAGIENFTWHDMRHDYASQLVMAGVDLNTVRELLGHSDIKMTLRYAHLAPEHKKAAVTKLGQRRDDLLQK